MKKFAVSVSLLAFLCIFTALLAFPVCLAASGGEGGHGEGADSAQNLWSMGIKLVNFAVLVFILVKFLAKPLANYLSARAESIRTRMHDLETRKTAAAGAADEYARRLEEMDQEIARLKETARLDMEREKEQVLAEAQRTAQEVLHHAQETVKREFAKARADLHREAVDLSLELAEGLIVKQMNEKDQRRLAEDYIQKIGRSS